MMGELTTMNCILLHEFTFQGLVLKGWIEMLSGRETKKAAKFFEDAFRYYNFLIIYLCVAALSLNL